MDAAVGATTEAPPAEAPAAPAEAPVEANGRTCNRESGLTRGVHKGKSPLHLSGLFDAPTDWLVALGYPPEEAGATPMTAIMGVAA